MRTYGSIQTKFWSHLDIHLLSDQAKLLALYLLSSSHTNMLGCFRIPIGYIAEDLRWTVDIASKAINDLVEIEFLTYDTVSSWVIIHNFLKFHPIENPNQGRSIEKLFDEVPKNLKFRQQLITKLLQQTRHLDQIFCEQLETLSKPFLNQEQDQDQKQKQEQRISSGKPDIVSLHENLKIEKNTTSPKNQEAMYGIQAIEILNFL